MTIEKVNNPSQGSCGVDESRRLLFIRMFSYPVNAACLQEYINIIRKKG